MAIQFANPTKLLLDWPLNLEEQKNQYGSIISVVIQHGKKYITRGIENYF